MGTRHAGAGGLDGAAPPLFSGVCHTIDSFFYLRLDVL